MQIGSASRVSQVSRLAPRQSYWVPLRLKPYGWWNPEISRVDTTGGRPSFSAINSVGTSGSNLIQSTKTNQPSLTTKNGRRAVNFVAASSHFLGFSVLSMLANQTRFYLFTVTQGIDVGTAEMPLFSATTNSNAATRLTYSAFTQGSTNLQMGSRRTDGGSIATVGVGANTTNWQTLEYLTRWDNATGTIWQNGNKILLDASMSAMGTGLTSSTNSTIIRLGRGAATGSASLFYNGIVADLIAFRSALTDAERLLLQNYSNKRWAVLF